MDLCCQKLAISGLLFLISTVSDVYAVSVINLRHPPAFLLQSWFPISKIKNQTFRPLDNPTGIKEINRSVDSRHMLHIRLQETYLGYEVIGAEAVVHVPAEGDTPNSVTQLAATRRGDTMNGIFYQDLHADLANTSPHLFTQAQAQKALQQGISLYQQKVGYHTEITEQKSKLMIYVDENRKARWVYHIHFHAESADTSQIPAAQIYILDANTFEVIATWDDIQTLAIVGAEGGGLGGNIKTGQRMYDGLSGHLASLSISRDDRANLCYLQNESVTVKNFNTKNIMSFRCPLTDANHNNVYWNASFDSVNQAFSPGNDAFFGAIAVKNMYQEWYGTPILQDENGNTRMLNLFVHRRNYENAYWDPGNKIMVFGDGYINFYPLTSVDIAAHELSHAFTSQHSRLFFSGESGAMNESFSDMAAQAAEVYVYGLNSWTIAEDVVKKPGKALRYLDFPSKDCESKVAESGCSINDASQYRKGLDVHFASGIYNRFFYLLSTSPGWDVKKAFDVMVHTNLYYWTSASTFNEGACNVISAAQQLGYDTDAVKNAFNVVKVNYQKFC